jgi:CheY-like chemotaxis protein
MSGRNHVAGEVLIVDDNKDLRELNRLRLEPHYTVNTAATGTECLEVLSHDVDVVFLDRTMPGLTGEETAHKIKNSPYSPAVVMLSANVPDVDILDIPCDGYIEKPADKSDLVAVIERSLALPIHESQLRKYHSLKSKVQTLQRASHRCFEASVEFQQAVSELQSLERHLPQESARNDTATSS